MNHPKQVCCPELHRAPELPGGRHKLNADASLAAGTSAHVDDAAFLFGLIAHVGQKQSLAARDDGLKSERTAVLVSVDGFRFFVERLFVCIRAVDQQGYVMRVTQTFAAVGVAWRGIARPVRGGCTILSAGPLSFRLL